MFAWPYKRGIRHTLKKNDDSIANKHTAVMETTRHNVTDKKKTNEHLENRTRKRTMQQQTLDEMKI